MKLKKIIVGSAVLASLFTLSACNNNKNQPMTQSQKSATKLAKSSPQDIAKKAYSYDYNSATIDTIRQAPLSSSKKTIQIKTRVVYNLNKKALKMDMIEPHAIVDAKAKGKIHVINYADGKALVSKINGQWGPSSHDKGRKENKAGQTLVTNTMKIFTNKKANVTKSSIADMNSQLTTLDYNGLANGIQAIGQMKVDNQTGKATYISLKQYKVNSKNSAKKKLVSSIEISDLNQRNDFKLPKDVVARLKAVEKGK